MTYKESQIRELLLTKQNQRSNIFQLNRKSVAAAQSSLLQLFLLKHIDKDVLLKDASFKEYITKPMEQHITRRKAERILQFVTLPLKATSITEKAERDLFRVFNAGNSVIEIEQIEDSNGKRLFEAIDKTELNNTIVDFAKEAMTLSPDMVTVVLKDNDGYPYIIKVKFDKVIDAELKQSGDNAKVELTKIAFEHTAINPLTNEEVEAIYFIDSEKVEVYLKLNNEYVHSTALSYSLDIGYCPARYFNVKAIDKDGLVKENQFTSALGELQKYTHFDIFGYYVDHYVPFPVTERPKMACGDNSCNDGKVMDGDIAIDCPKCEIIKANNSLGIGTTVEITPDSEGKSVSGLYKFISPSVEGSKYVDEKQFYREEFILSTIRGVAQSSTKEAINEVQVQSNFESQNNVLLGLKELLDRYHYWVVYTYAVLINKDLKPAISIDYGTEYYLQDDLELQNEYKNAKEAGLPSIELSLLYDRIIQKKFKNTPDKLQYVELVNLIDPMPFNSYAEKIQMYKDGVVSKEDLLLSIHLPKLIQTFEMESKKSILQIGVAEGQAKAIETIKRDLIDILVSNNKLNIKEDEVI